MDIEQLKLVRPQLLPRETPATESLKFPLLISPKLDGIRCLVNERGEAASRTLKPIPNRFIQEQFRKHPFLRGCDGELIVGKPYEADIYRKTNSAVMSHDGEPNFTYFVFDIWISDKPFKARYQSLLEWERKLPPWVHVLSHYEVFSEKGLDYFESSFVDVGYEGAILRNPEGLYKQNRCTVKEANAFKLKRYMDDEARIIGYAPEYENTNEAEINEVGLTKRSTKKEGLKEKDSLGTVLVEHPSFGTFYIGSGWAKAERETLWKQREELIGKYAKFKYFPIGMKDKPRHPIFLGFRNMEIDE